MTLEERLIGFFGLNDETWMRHATAASVISRALIPPMITAAALSRVWIGNWWWLLLALIVGWTFLNVRVFPRAKRYDNWYAYGAFGERIYSKRKRVPIPTHHESSARGLTLLNVVCSLIWLYGLYALNVELAITGTLLQLTAKFWFIDRMAWLYLSMQDDPNYAHLKALTVHE
jgi:hypothetical protein